MEQPFFQLIASEGMPIALVALFVASIIEYVFPPFPGDTIFLFGAFLAGKGVLPVPLVFAAGSLGSFAGSLVIYALGRTKGRDYFLRKDFSFFSAEKVRALEDRFSRWGGAIIAANRFAPGFRPFFFVAAGIAGMGALRVAAYSMVSIILWNAGIFWLGYRVGQEWTRMKGFLELYSNIVIIFISAVIVIYVVVLVVRARRKRKQSPQS
jgi:membrane protein DedA with SNARE-associated domain